LCLDVAGIIARKANPALVAKAMRMLSGASNLRSPAHVEILGALVWSLGYVVVAEALPGVPEPWAVLAWLL
jgi:hypothetical protein